MREHYDTDSNIELLINNGSPECDPFVCCDELRQHVCYRMPFHSGAHCCGGLCDGRNPCRYLWENTTFREEDVITEREV